jgi:alpha-glucosidase
MRDSLRWLGSLVLAACTACWAHAADDGGPLTAVSPDGRNAIELSLDGNPGRRSIRLRITRRGRPVLLVSPLDVQLAAHGWLSDGSRIASRQQRMTNETFVMPWGKSRQVTSHASRAQARLVNRAGLAWEIELIACDDGVGYRYRLPAQDDFATAAIEDEAADYQFAGNPTMHYTACKRFTTDHESEFRRQPLTDLPRETLLDLPLLAVWPDGSAAAVTEARLRDFAGMYLVRRGPEPVLRSRLSTARDTPGSLVILKPPHASPWRIVQLGDRAGELLESNLLVTLNDTPPPGDYSWARPGKTTWHWWNGTAEQGLPFPCGMNLATHKYYVDFCAAHGIAYHAVVADDRPWYVQAAKDFAPHDDTDILTPRPELELPKLLEYARRHGVGIRLWVHWLPLERRLEEALAKYAQWGISGLMVDFLDRDDQAMVNFCDRVLESAARHKLHIQFHGSYKPSGEWRTFPHLFNREGVLNLEYLKWSSRCTPPHNVESAYVRALAGPLDYHLGGFRSVARSQFVPRNENPLVLGTRCHHLAMYVVYENPMPMVCDAPSAYANQPGFEFIVAVPTTWDETRFVAGDAGDYLVMARRAGTKWYLGGMTDWTAREVNVPLDFLADGRYEARLFVDGSQDETKPNAIRIDTRTVAAGSSLTIAMAPGGGFAAIVTTGSPP